MQAGSVLAHGVTIATRYCAIRRQFQDRDAPEWEKGENAVLNYTMVQIRLLPLLAATFALDFMGKGMVDLYQENQKWVNQGNVTKESDTSGAGPEETELGSDILADLHATSCGLKALSSSIAAEGLQVCRRACGGHSYSSSSGIGTRYSDFLPTTTWEGDNYMLTRRFARYLLKSARTVLRNSTPANDTTHILSNFQSHANIGCAFDILGSDSDVVAAFVWRASFLTFEALEHCDEQKKPWNDLFIDFYRLGDGKVYEDIFYRASKLNPLKKVTVGRSPESEVSFRWWCWKE